MMEKMPFLPFVIFTLCLVHRDKNTYLQWLQACTEHKCSSWSNTGNSPNAQQHQNGQYPAGIETEQTTDRAAFVYLKVIIPNGREQKTTDTTVST